MAKWNDKVKGRLGFGCMRLPMANGTFDYEKACEMIDAFMAGGCNYFDTAHVYMEGHSEAALRECLVKRYPRESFVITDKVSGKILNVEDDIDPLLESELKELGVDYIDNLFMHGINVDQYEKFNRMHAFDHARAFLEAGKAHHFGISYHDSPEFLNKVLDEHPEIELVQIQFNYTDLYNHVVQSLGCYKVCEERGLLCTVMEPVKGGYLMNLPPSVQEVVDAIPNPEGLSNAGFALRFAASYPNNAVILSGMGDIDQVKENVATMADPKPLSEEQMEGLLHAADVLREIGMIECTGCHYCTSGCPMHIRIPEILSCLNVHRVFGGWNPRWYYRNTCVVDEHAPA